MRNLATAALFTITLFQLANFEPVRADIGKTGDEKVLACIEACRAFIDQPGWELRACMTRCESQR